MVNSNFMSKKRDSKNYWYIKSRDFSPRYWKAPFVSSGSVGTGHVQVYADTSTLRPDNVSVFYDTHKIIEEEKINPKEVPVSVSVNIGSKEVKFNGLLDTTKGKKEQVKVLVDVAIEAINKAKRKII